MKELALDVCQAGEAVYLTLGLAGEDVLEPGDGRAWLILNDDLYVDVTRQTDSKKRPVIARVSPEDLPKDENGAVLVESAMLETAAGSVELEPTVRRLGDADKLKGHVAAVAEGAIQGWVSDHTNRRQELPVEVEIPGEILIGMSKGRWHGDAALRAFKVRLPTSLPQLEPFLVRVTAMPGGEAFRRTPLFLTLTQLGWLVAAPMRLEGTTLGGEFQFAPAPNKPVTMTLTLADGQAFEVVCSLDTEVRFGGRPCGFRIENLSPGTLSGARLKISHDLFGKNALCVPVERFFIDRTVLESTLVLQEGSDEDGRA